MVPFEIVFSTRNLQGENHAKARGHRHCNHRTIARGWTCLKRSDFTRGSKYPCAGAKLHADRESRLRAEFWRAVRSIPSLGLLLWPLLVRPLLIATGPTSCDRPPQLAASSFLLDFRQKFFHFRRIGIFVDQLEAAREKVQPKLPICLRPNSARFRKP